MIEISKQRLQPLYLWSHVDLSAVTYSTLHVVEKKGEEEEADATSVKARPIATWCNLKMAIP